MCQPVDVQEQPFIKDNSRTVGDVIKSTIATIGENIQVQCRGLVGSAARCILGVPLFHYGIHYMVVSLLFHRFAGLRASHWVRASRRRAMILQRRLHSKQGALDCPADCYTVCVC
jgi:hypothetical protein